MTSAEKLHILKIGSTNCYLLKCREGYLQIDTSYPNQFDAYLGELRRINVDVSEIKYLLLTHHHDDHAGFAADLRERSGCRIIAHKDAVASLESGQFIKANRRPINLRVTLAMSMYNKNIQRDFKFPPVPLGENDIVLAGDDNDLLQRLGMDGKILCTPGHTNDSLSVILADGNAFVGDVCMNFPAFFGTHYRPIGFDNLGLVFESWRKLIENGANVIYPSHGKPFTVGGLIRYEKKYAGDK